MTTAHAYLIDGKPVESAEFIAVACNPAQSVVVEACAGSGKTWLLVARMLRLLLAGAAPSELLAITFTRKAAQEMRERLFQLLEDIALGDEAQASKLLTERGIPPRDLPHALPLAQSLYERVLSSPQSLSIDTFHSWFARLVQIAPLTSGVPHGYALAENTAELQLDAHTRFMQSLTDEKTAQIREALLNLYQAVGDTTTRKLLDAFLDKRAEWWAACQQGHLLPLAWLQALLGEDGVSDPRPSLWQDQRLIERFLTIARLLGQGAKRNQDRAVAIESAITDGPHLDNFSKLFTQFFDDNLKPRGNDHRRGKLLTAIEQHYGAQAIDAFDTEFNDLGRELLLLQRRSCEAQVLALNEKLFVVGDAYLAQYQAVKAEQRVFDFTDLEWHAYRLLANEDHAAYLHSRLDARYKHILLDEFQDTNPLQWSIVRAWLAAYGDDVQQPSVFVVGDPKQSIYRFRRAEPRVFDAARTLLAGQGAAVLQTNQTRRNTAAIIDALNASLRGNRLYSPQTTLATGEGAVWRLPLVQPETDETPNTPKTQAGFSLRDPLTAAREEEDDIRRYEEGRQIAVGLIKARRERDVSWSETMLLVRKRKHLAAYESALREAGIPFVSDKRGGLLQSLEVADLIALLTFLITPGDDRALAHVLKSPIISADDQDLVGLAEAGEGSWWQRLQRLRDQASPALQRAAHLLNNWLAVAPTLPVHDLIDLVLHQGELIARYAAAARPLLRDQVRGNIEAFTELALNLDAGRYPSLPKFIDALRVLQKGAESDAPNEAPVADGIDAVRILTIHSAKGLEARVVALVDANHSKAARDDCGILCDWPQDENAPTHFSSFHRQNERGLARDNLFAAEDALMQQEDWNLLYVAATRAKEILIVSGVADGKSAALGGLLEDSWYCRLQAVPEWTLPDHELQALQSGLHSASAALGNEDSFLFPVFEPPMQKETAPVPTNRSNAAIEEGIALHALLERLTQNQTWPITVPDSAAVARWLGCSASLAAIVRNAAETLLQQPQLERFFNPALFDNAWNELEIMDGETVLRLDRVVVATDAVWILDYKRDLLPSEIADYADQLARYRHAAGRVFPGRVLRAAVITADGRLQEMELPL